MGIARCNEGTDERNSAFVDWKGSRGEVPA